MGGPCLPSNSYYLIMEGLKVGTPDPIRLAREVNDRMPDHMVELTSEALNEIGQTVSGARIAVLGIAYKPEVKDIQLTPIEHIIDRLRETTRDHSRYTTRCSWGTRSWASSCTRASKTPSGARTA